jgi:hypothetical protein
MNCFNIRELQGILKRRFFVDLVNSHDHKNVLSAAMIGVKHRLHNNENINLDITMFYNWGILKNQNHKVVYFDRGSEELTRSYSSTFNFALIEFVNVRITLKPFFDTLTLYVYNFFYLFNFSNFFTSFFSVAYFTLSTFFLNVFYIISLSFSMLKSEMEFVNLQVSVRGDNTSDVSTFFSKDMDTAELITNFSFTENSSAQRLTRFSSPLIGYDYKTGHYLGLSEKLYPQLIMSFIEVARGIRKPSWLFSEQYIDLLNQSYSNYFANFTGKINLKLSNVED